MNFVALRVLNILIVVESLLLIYSIQGRGVGNRIHGIFKIYLLMVALTAFAQIELGLAETPERFLFWKSVNVFPFLCSFAKCLLLVFYIGDHIKLAKYAKWLLVPAAAIIFALFRIFLQPESLVPSPWGFSSVYDATTWNTLAILLISLSALEMILAAIFVYKRLVIGPDRRNMGTWLFLIGFILTPIYALLSEGFNMWYHFIPLPLRVTDIYIVSNALFFLSINKYDILDPALAAISARVTDTIKDGLVLTDTGNMITYANPAFLMMAGLTEEAALKKSIGSCFIAIKDADIMVSISMFESAATIELRQHILYSETSQKGLFVDVTGTIVRSKARQPLGVAYIIRDISDAKRNEERRRHIADVLQHDLRSRLHGILQLEEIREPMDGPGARSIDRSIMLALQNTLIKIDSYLVADRMEGGSYMINPEPLELCSLFYDSIDFIQAQVEGKGLAIEFDASCRESVPFEIETDRFLLSVLFRSLVSNAVQAAPEGSRILVAIGRHESGTEIRIHNDGAIPEEVRNDFMRAYVSSRKGAGHGIGAFGARFIAEELEGSVDFHTSEENGTTILVRLPLSLHR